ncbi:urease accessory protein [Nocardioides luteus]|uniref:Urease accessory protein UreF n=1 Tax=Nocardioides luteus TaxID=1844 RepID=A0ABQ5STA7_9ACTN|nr:urease accessory UreF family protein [Nocardioides luteus]MDR7311232.1 urease accessory protein [Nocardioides luteus]GGR63204.1 urease accessory protein UreF [Nocardioides luteus]GLJ66779.1 urease accessory protein UreF [Nocardioides luteus]
MADDLMLMLLADARLPVAGHTQSGQLEAAVRSGLTAAQVSVLMRSRLGSVARVEAGTAVVALHRLRAGLPLAPVVDAWAARTPAAPMRETSHTLARALLRLVRRLFPDSPHVADAAGVEGVCRPIVLAAAAAAGGISPASLGRLVAYDDLQTVASAALKLLPLDPLDATSWVHDLLPAADRLATEVAALTSPDEIPAPSAPQLDLWALAHAATTRRLFSA